MMNRGIGEVEAAQDVVPETLLPVAESVTWFGDVSTLVAVTVIAALLLDRDRGLVLFGTVIGGFALLTGLKAAFGLPRPPAELHLIATETTGFPSGHALGATLVYGGLACLLRVGTRQIRFVAVGLGIALITLSRIVLGVHYLIDSAAGVLIAAGYLWGMRRYTGQEPRSALMVGAVLGVFAVLAGIAFGPTLQTACIGAVCLDMDTVQMAMAGMGAVGAWMLGRIYRIRSVGLALLALGGLSGGGLILTGSGMLTGLVATVLGGSTVVVAIEHGVVHRWVSSLYR